VQGIVGNRPGTQARSTIVASHYQQLGGFSPYNALTFQQARAIQTLLKEQHIDLPIYVGMRHWPPYIHTVLSDMAAQGQHNILAVIMAPHQCFASWEWYQQTVEEGLAALGTHGLQVSYLAPWYTHPGYLTAIVEHLQQATQELGEARAQAAALIYTAHSIPQTMAATAPYAEQFAATAAAATQLLGHTDYRLAYQSQVTGTPRPWLQPDINDVIRQAASEGYRDIMVSPIGFLCDHVEVLYDLDVAARDTATACGVNLVRASTVGNHPAFLTMLRDLLVERLREG
jgi:ferrochelatase